MPLQVAQQDQALIDPIVAVRRGKQVQLMAHLVKHLGKAFDADDGIGWIGGMGRGRRFRAASYRLRWCWRWASSRVRSGNSCVKF